MKRLILIGIQAFNGLTAVGGGTALMAGAIKVPQWYERTAFVNGYFPGLILFAIVGGSALLAALALYKRAIGAEIASLLAGLIMLFWIIGEVVSIRTPHILQLVYVITGLTVLLLTPKTMGQKASS